MQEELPIYSLPSELLAHCFDLTITKYRCTVHHEDSDWIWRCSLDFCQDPVGPQRCVQVDISHVSRPFRAIALATGSLWTSIEPQIMQIQTRRNATFPNNLEKVKAFLTRSGTQELDVAFTQRLLNAWGINSEEPLDSETRMEIDSLMDVIFLHAHRWKSLHISSIHKTKSLRVLHDRLKNMFAPRLHKLDVQVNDFDSNIASGIFRNGAPLLSNVRLQGQCFWPSLTSVKSLVIPESLAECRTYNGMTTSQIFVSTISFATSLTELDIGEICDDDWNVDNLPDIIFPELKMLRIRAIVKPDRVYWEGCDGVGAYGLETDHISHIFNILYKLKAPQLEKLMLDNIDEPRLDRLGDHPPNVTTQFPRLCMLELGSGFWQDIHLHSEDESIYLAPLFRAFPSISSRRVIEVDPEARLEDDCRYRFIFYLTPTK